jgi:hypothetical protein
MKTNLKNVMWGLGVEKARDKMRKDGAKGKIQIITWKYKKRGKSLVLRQVNCRSIYNKALECGSLPWEPPTGYPNRLWNFVDTYNPDIVIGMESWLREEISNT